MGGFLGFHFRSKKQHQAQSRRSSTLNGRYGSSTITFPSEGAYASPRQKSRGSSVPPTTLYVGDIDSGIDTSSPPRSSGKNHLHVITPEKKERTVVHYPHPKEVLGPASEIPIHPAYLIEIPEPVSPTTTIASDSTWKGSQPSSPVRTKAPSFKENRHYNPLSSHPPSVLDISTIKRDGSQTRHTKPRSHSRTGSTERTLKFYTDKQDDHDNTSSRIYPPPLNTSMGRARTQSRQRAPSRPRNTQRASSTVSERRRSTMLVGLGNSNASQQTFDNTGHGRKPSRGKRSASTSGYYYDDNNPNLSSGRGERDRSIRTPVSAEEELWPGRY